VKVFSERDQESETLRRGCEQFEAIYKALLEEAS
jgi:hypothetical protein